MIHEIQISRTSAACNHRILVELKEARGVRLMIAGTLQKMLQTRLPTFPFASVRCGSVYQQLRMSAAAEAGYFTKFGAAGRITPPNRRTSQRLRPRLPGDAPRALRSLYRGELVIVELRCRARTG